MRDNRFDYYKGILMIGVVWGHVISNMLCGQHNEINIHWIFRLYDMPFFMLISGFFLQKSLEKYTLKQILIDKATTIAVPSIIFSFLISRFKGIDCFYFLSAVFVSSIIVALFHHIISNRIVRVFSFVVVCVILHLIDFNYANLSYLLPFFIFGYYGGGILLGKTRYFLLNTILLVSAMSFWSTQYTIWNAGAYLLSGGDILWIVPFRFIIALLGIVTVKRLMDVAYDYHTCCKGHSYDFIQMVGRETLMLYILHIFALEFVKKGSELLANHLGYNPFVQNQVFFGYVLAPIVTVGILFCCLFVIRHLKQNRYTRLVCGFKLNDLRSLSTMTKKNRT